MKVYTMLLNNVWKIAVSQYALIIHTVINLCIISEYEIQIILGHLQLLTNFFCNEKLLIHYSAKLFISSPQPTSIEMFLLHRLTLFKKKKRNISQIYYSAHTILNSKADSLINLAHLKGIAKENDFITLDFTIESKK